ncbi:MAG: recombinase family protein [Acidimicrobiia bacterium]
MRTVRSAAVYARISSDQDGSALGVSRQLDDCRRLARESGWVVGHEYVDNDVSAFSGKRRPAFEQLLTDVRDGFRDGVIVYHHDRLTRSTKDLDRFVDVLSAAGSPPVQFVSSGNLDIGNGDGLLLARILAAVASDESASKGRRVRRKLDEVAAAGRPHGGSHRPFGYESDRITVRADEAAVIRGLVERFLAGESLRSLATWLDANEVRTVAGGPWKTPTLRAMLRSGRIAGLREHRGEVVGPAVWEPIISPADRDRVLARMEERALARRRAPRSYLLTGLLRCGRCGNKLFSSRRETTRRYVCASGPDHGGCGRMTVVAGPLEELIAEAVLYRLDSPELADALAGRAGADEQAGALSEELAQARRQLDELAALHGRGEISQREWLAARKPVQDRIGGVERQLGRLTQTSALTGWVGNAAELRSRWAELNLGRQHAIVAALLDHAVIKPAAQARSRFDPNRVDPVWRI